MSLVSIIVPVYNTEKYLDKCVESLVLQTLRDIEIILVDDGSPDNCPKKCDDWAKKDSRIKVIHQENRGLVSARNAGIKKSASEYIGFVDSDDWVEKEMFQILYENIIKNDADIVQCGVELVHENGESENIGRKEEVVYRDNEAFKNIVKPYFQEDFYLDGLNSYLWNKVYKKT